MPPNCRNLCPIAALALAAVLQGASAAPAFDDVSAAAGIDHAGPSWGAAWGDLDGDGFPDLWETNHGMPASIYINRGDGSFAERSSRWGDVLVGPDPHAVSWVDYDNDGDQDVHQTTGAGRGMLAAASRFYVNTGGELAEGAEQLGLAQPLARGRTPLWFDFDRDGLLDVLLNNGARKAAPTRVLRQADGVFVPAPETGVDIADGVLFALASYLDTGQLHLLLGDGHRFPRRLYNAGTLPFAAVANAERVPPVERATDAVIADFTGDLRPDLLVARGYLANDLVQRGSAALDASFRVNPSAERGFAFASDGAVTFDLHQLGFNWWQLREIHLGDAGGHPAASPFTLSPAVATSRDARAVATGDNAIVIGHDPTSATWTVWARAAEWRAVSAVITSTAAITGLQAREFKAFTPALEQQLLAGDDSGFRDITSWSGLSAVPGNCFAVAAGDFDNDMDLDAYLGCSGSVDNRDNLLLENTGDGRLRPVQGNPAAAGAGSGRTDRVAVADYDNDGFLDLYVSNGQGLHPFNNGPQQLLRNRGNDNHWLTLQLVGTASNRDAIGSTVWVSAGDRTQLREQMGGMHMGAQDHARVHVGLGEFIAADVLVRWPGGHLQRLQGVAADQVVTLIEDRQRAVDIALVATRTALDVGQTGTFRAYVDPAIGADLQRIDWQLGDGHAAGATRRVAHAFTAPGAYTVTATAVSNSGQAWSDSVQVTVAAPEQSAAATSPFGPVPAVFLLLLAALVVLVLRRRG
ncbi:MAG: FG-GAP-like repeat-containing protein [Halioglobus sp.]|nr:FG-GAP-like repeat-containing protein [Halioglobus sp.]